MAARLVRSLSLRFSIPEELSAAAETVVQGLDSCLGDGCIACLTQTRRTSWQVTVKSVEAKHRLLTAGFQVKGTYVSCMSIEPDVVFVTVKMPFEMADTPIRTILSTYGIVTSVRRLTYSFARDIETGVRSFRLTQVKPGVELPKIITVGTYHLATRSQVPGQPRVCFRCKSPGHYIKDCPQPRQVDSSARQVSNTHEQAHEQQSEQQSEQPSVDRGLPPFMTDEVPRWPDMPLSLPPDKEDEGWLQCTVERNNDADDTTEQTSLSVDRPMPAERVQTGMDIPDADVSTQQSDSPHETVATVAQSVDQPLFDDSAGKQMDADPHKTVVSIREDVDQVEQLSTVPSASCTPLSEHSPPEHMMTQSSADVDSNNPFVIPSQALVEAMRKNKPVAIKRAGIEASRRKPRRRSARTKSKANEPGKNDPDIVDSDVSDVSQT